MADADTSFDPRFDPRFQPGYDPEKHSDATRVDTIKDAAEQPASPRDAPLPIVDAEDLEPGGELDQPDTGQEDAAPRRLGTLALLVRNPFLWVIVVAGVALVAWGWSSYLSAIETTQTFMFRGYNPEDEATAEDYATAQFVLGVAPLAIAVGLLSIVGTVFFGAVTWFRAHRK
ncbi:hypothetical protein ACSAGD_01470 [Paramicrobacterium sp. CJ85]|uniref:hypothetical protein n=1 Tax=Paramicrobacterium sp. CJ85 TaxID=3445355 RepID=UPI003F60FB5C